jgi:hypothetical protein
MFGVFHKGTILGVQNELSVTNIRDLFISEVCECSVVYGDCGEQIRLYEDIK